MRFSDTLRTVNRSLKRRKGRTALTAIGVTIGTAAIVAMMSLAIGLNQLALKEVDRFGSLTEVEVYPGYNPNNPASAPQLTQKVIEKIKLLPGVTAVMPKLRLNAGQGEIEIGRNAGMVEVYGVDTKEAENFSYKMDEGKFLTGDRNEAVLSYNVPDVLGEKKKRSHKSNKLQESFQQVQSPGSSQGGSALRPKLVNKTAMVTITKQGENGIESARQIRIRIVGVLDQERGGASITLPLETVRELNEWAGSADEQNSKIRDGDEEVYDTLVVKVPDREQVENVTNQIRGMGYYANSLISQLKEINTVFLVLKLVLGGIGAISLLVASIGIINTMVMSILERTREIGVMKVLGATIPNVRNLFLIEAGAIGFIGGFAGLVISYSLAGIINLVTQRIMTLQKIPEGTIGDIAVIPWWLTLFALVFSTTIGILAGIYPALRAAKLSPLNAIRQE